MFWRTVDLTLHGQQESESWAGLALDQGFDALRRRDTLSVTVAGGSAPAVSNGYRARTGELGSISCSGPFGNFLRPASPINLFFATFSTIVIFVFNFLETQFGFRANLLNERSVQYELGDTFIRVSHSAMDEVSLCVGALSRGFAKSFSAGVLIALTSPARGFALRDRIAFKQDQVEHALCDLAQVLRDHGQRVLIADSIVCDDMQRLVNNHWADRNDAQIRQRAEMPFAAKDFAGALQQYRLRGERRKPLDAERMELCRNST